MRTAENVVGHEIDVAFSVRIYSPIFEYCTIHSHAIAEIQRKNRHCNEIG